MSFKPNLKSKKKASPKLALEGFPRSVDMVGILATYARAGVALDESKIELVPAGEEPFAPEPRGFEALIKAGMDKFKSEPDPLLALAGDEAFWK